MRFFSSYMIKQKDVAETTLPITGGCMCGAVRYELSEPPSGGGTCHCRTCQRQSGSAFIATAGFSESALHFTKGEPKCYQSSSIMTRSFCADCGSPITNQYLVALGDLYLPQPDIVYVHIGTLDEPEAAPIECHYGVERQLPWVHFDDGLPRTRMDEDSMLAAAFAAGDSKLE